MEKNIFCDHRFYKYVNVLTLGKYGVWMYYSKINCLFSMIRTETNYLMPRSTGNLNQQPFWETMTLVFIHYTSQYQAQ